MKLLKSITATILLLTSAATLAFDPVHGGGGYIGLQVGAIKADSKVSVILPVPAVPAVPPVPTFTTFKLDDDSIDFGLLEGYGILFDRFYLAVELQQRMGRIQPAKTFVIPPPTPAAVSPGTATFKIDLREPFSFNFIPGVYLNDNILFFLFIACSNVDLRFREFINPSGGGTTLNLERSKFDFKIKYGTGLHFFLDDTWGVRLMYSYLDYPGFDFVDPNPVAPATFTIRSTKEQQFWLGVTYSFGGGDEESY